MATVAEDVCGVVGIGGDDRPPLGGELESRLQLDCCSMLLESSDSSRSIDA